MPIKFTVTPKRDPRDQEAAPKYYAVVKSNGRSDTHAVAKSINRMSTVTSVDTAAVLEAFLTVVPEELASGRIVELGEFGTFRASVSSEGAAQASEAIFNFASDDFLIRAGGFKNPLRDLANSHCGFYLCR